MMGSGNCRTVKHFTAYALRQNTTTSLSKPDEVHNLGVAEVARIETEMRALLDANGYAGRSDRGGDGGNGERSALPCSPMTTKGRAGLACRECTRG